jgi:hypothetical protein
MDEVLAYLRSKVKEAEENSGVDSVQVVYALEELSAELRKKNEKLEAVNVEARIRAVRQKLGIEVASAPAPALPGRREYKNVVYLTIILFLGASVATAYSGIPVCAAFGACLGVLALYMLFKVADVSIPVYVGCVLAWALVSYGVPMMLKYATGNPLKDRVDHACAMIERGKYVDAKQELDKLIAQNPSSPCLLARAECELAMERYDDAVRDGNAAAFAVECRQSSALAILGIANEHLRNYQLAVEQLQAALRIDQNVHLKRKVFISLAKSLAALNRMDESREFFEKAKKL